MKTDLTKFFPKEVTKQEIKSISSAIVQTNNPLKTYIAVKAMEIIVKDILDNKHFRKLVKKDYLKQTEGALSKYELYGVTVKPVSQEKKNALAKVYEYSPEVKDLINHIELDEINLKSKKDRLKQMQLREINNGTAKEISIESIIEAPAKESDVLDSFNISIEFK